MVQRNPSPRLNRKSLESTAANEEAVYRLLYDDGAMSAAEIGEHFGWMTEKTRTMITSLAAEGRLSNFRRGQTMYYYVPLEKS